MRHILHRCHYHYTAIAQSPSTYDVLCIPKANIYRFGDPNSAQPVLRDVNWTVREGESWAVVGSGASEKTALLETLLGNMRISPPPPGGPFPSLSLKQSRPINESVFLVSFAHRQPAFSGGAFYDYTARYGVVREEDRVTLRQSMFPEESGLVRDSIKSFIVPNNFSAYHEHEQQDPTSQKEEKARRFEELIDKLELGDLLDLPLVALSNGQTRRARIVKALLEQPDILLLDEPLTGLDFKTRPRLLSLLHSLHASNNPRIIMGLRLQDPIPEWITHIALVQGGRVKTGDRSMMLNELDHAHIRETARSAASVVHTSNSNSEVLVDMQNVNVRYHERHVLKDINWTIRSGDRWHLQGANGSGKTTLLSVLTGDHPQSYTQRAPTSALTLFGIPRVAHATVQLRSRIGVVSPELYNAWPRARNMTVWEAIATGFDGGSSPWTRRARRGRRNWHARDGGELNEGERKWRADRVWEVLRGLGPHTWDGTAQGEATLVEEFARLSFAEIPAGVQSMVLLMRALVGRPPLVLLDEVWAGMDEGMVRAARAYLREGGAVVVVSHWEDEVPWGVDDGVKRFKLENGVGTVTMA
ncbi:P-loop containing nucleoside triphosphate hydrolase protein [Multifurca ochricompacta]|uniref:P-loop containing nucleoside triphosphate hydrolase protein n=1 Tax=Multifurca ochricompacta TaxID=376703 RepID=A0AAD4QLC8_9AGAM|nr:P-loop containing nucleoside triphosphate hydrolase protein [Multifurca ochricompacta]